MSSAASGAGLSEACRGAVSGVLSTELAESYRDTLASVPGIRLPESYRGGIVERPVPDLPEPALGLAETVHSELPDWNLGPAAKGLFSATPEFRLANLVPGLFPDLPEEHGSRAAPLEDVAGYTEMDRPLKARDASEAGTSLEYMLRALNPAFAAQFNGWILRSEERGPDWCTQAAASLRKLLLGLLHTVAPDDLVLEWVTNRSTQLDRCGHPTRRAKVDWLCRSIRDKRYRKFVRAEFDSALAILDMLNQAIHGNEYPELEESFSSVSARVTFVIRQMVTLGKRKLPGSRNSFIN